MTFSNKVMIIKERLKAAFEPEMLQVLDESSAHAGHGGYSANGSHYAVIITATELAGLSRVEQHRKIYALFEDMIPHDIHALRIEVK